MNQKAFFILPMMLAAAAQNRDLFDTGHKARYQPQSEYRRKDLPRFKIGDSIIYAKDIKTAIKYAKKRGLYKPDIEIIPLDQPRDPEKL